MNMVMTYTKEDMKMAKEWDFHKTPKVHGDEMMADGRVPMHATYGMGEDNPTPYVPMTTGMGEDIIHDNPRLNPNMSKDSSFNERKRQESVQLQINEKVVKVNQAIMKYKDIKDLSVIGVMDFLEELIGSAGGESRVAFLEVDRKMVKIGTRMPMKANLHPMVGESKDNPRFHKFITQILMSMNFISAVKWIPTESGSLIIIELV